MISYTLFPLLLILLSLDLTLGSLELLHILLRQGKRTPFNFYPRDPYKNETFYPVGLGGLLNEGKMSSYELGARLRKEYGCFLGSSYIDDIVYTMSTDFTSTRMSATLILAGLLPPNKEQKWHPHLDWQPIPVYTKPNKYEDIINPDCQHRQDMLRKLPTRVYIQKDYIEPYIQIYEYVEKHSGMEVRNMLQLLEFYYTIDAEYEMGLELPDWVKEIYPDNITSVLRNVHGYLNGNVELRLLNVGYLLAKIVNDIKAKIEDKLEPKNTKMFLFGSHGCTIGNMLDAMGLCVGMLPFSSALIFETHKDDSNEYYIMMKYLSGPRDRIKILKLYNCEEMCPFKKFLEINDATIPTKSLERACHISVTN